MRVFFFDLQPVYWLAGSSHWRENGVTVRENSGLGNPVSITQSYNIELSPNASFNHRWKCLWPSKYWCRIPWRFTIRRRVSSRRASSSVCADTATIIFRVTVSAKVAGVAQLK